jgi:hypothetical protein
MFPFALFNLGTTSFLRSDVHSNRPTNICSGSLAVDYESDLWADHDENCHGDIDTPENQREFPEGFIYSCCEKRGGSEGCEVGNHQAVDGKRTRY